MGRRTRIDRVVLVTRPVTLAWEGPLAVVVTRWGVVVVARHEDWTWYRWVMAGRWWSVSVAVGRTAGQAAREGQRLIRESQARARLAAERGRR